MPGLTPGRHAHVQNDVPDSVNATRGQFSILFDCRVDGGTGEFHDAVMYLYTD